MERAKFGVQIEEIVEEKREGKKGIGDELGMDLSGMFWSTGRI